MGQKIGAYEAKTKLSSLLREVKAGKSFTIAKNEVISLDVQSLINEGRS